MAASIKRGANVEFTREVPGLTRVVVGVRFAAGAEKVLLDNLVLATLMCDKSRRVLGPEHFVFFNQLSSPEESVAQRDALLGDDSDQVDIDLPHVPAEVERIVLVAYVNDGLAAKRTFGQLKECTVRLLDGVGGGELLRSENLAPAFTTETGAVLAEVYRHTGQWRFKVVGDGYANGIRDIARDYGVPL